jgi:hypothetical protein
MKIDFEELEKARQENFKERLKFIEFWVNFIKSNEDSIWSEKQNIVIEGQMSSE